MKIKDLIKYEIIMTRKGSIEFDDKFNSFNFFYMSYMYSLSRNISYKLFDTYGQYDSYVFNTEAVFNKKDHLEDTYK